MKDCLFQNPPNEYGEVAFFWWHGDKITREKLSWILNQLREKHICGLQINYCHGNSGGLSYGLTMESDPKPFSGQWWDLLAWFIDECKQLDIAVSLSDYTLSSPGQGLIMDTVLEKHPEYIGQRLEYKDGVAAAVAVPNTLSPIAAGAGEAVIDAFYGRFEERFPGECGNGINYFFSDELEFNIRGNLWRDDFPEEFYKLKGYDILPKLAAIFEDIGSETPKIRLDYYDVIVRLSEEAFFKPVYDWHEERGMTFGCDHGGRGKDVTEFGDYFRTVKWYQGPGNDQPQLMSDVVKTKVSASIAHLYRRPRVWLEGFHSSGWQTSSADVADAIFRNFALGHNLLSLHGLYYSTHGSMWEWAPPCNHYHMPYWEEMGTLLLCSKRLSYLLSRGVHRSDVAIVYPVAAMEANPQQGEVSVRTAFSAAELLYGNGIDFDFIDFESVQRAEISEQKLLVSGEAYRYIVVPAMRAVRFGMLENLARFVSRGGSVIVLGEVPSESDRTGRDDAEVERLVSLITEACGLYRLPEELLSIIGENRDFRTDAPEPFYQHRLIDGEDLYFLYNIPKGSTCQLRAAGYPVVMDLWNGEQYRFEQYSQDDGYTAFAMPVEQTEPFILRFTKNCCSYLPAFNREANRVITVEGEWEMELIPTMDNRYGDYRLPAHNGYIGAEAREFRYRVTEDDCFSPGFDDSDWELGICSFTAYFWVFEGEETEENLASLTAPDNRFRPYSFSLRWGIRGDAGPQDSYHGLKGKLSDDFLGLGIKRITYSNSSCVYEGNGPYHLFTWVYTDESIDAVVMTGELLPDRIFVNCKQERGCSVTLAKGWNSLVLSYNKGGRTHFALVRKKGFRQTLPLATVWYKNPDLLPFSAYPDQVGKYCWYRFKAPPGLKSLKLSAIGETRVWCDGKELQQSNGRYRVEEPGRSASAITVQVRQEAGYERCAAIPEPVEFDCGTGTVIIGQSADELGLKYYSGGIQYTKTIEIGDSPESIWLDAGQLGCSVQVWVNGCHTANLVTPPYRCEITAHIREGANEIRLLVHNTLYNHMLTIPTNYNFMNS